MTHTRPPGWGNCNSDGAPWREIIFAAVAILGFFLFLDWANPQVPVVDRLDLRSESGPRQPTLAGDVPFESAKDFQQR